MGEFMANSEGPTSPGLSEPEYHRLRQEKATHYDQCAASAPTSGSAVTDCNLGPWSQTRKDLFQRNQELQRQKAVIEQKISLVTGLLDVFQDGLAR